MDSDRSLVKRFCAGDEQAFFSLVDRYTHMVLATCRRIVRDHHTAEDAAQMTFQTLARKAQTIRRRRCLAAWLHRVAYRKALRQRQLAQRRRERFDVDRVATAEACWQDIERRYELELLDQELQRLPLKYRQPLVLHYLLGCSQKETADVLGLRESTVKGRLQRGRAQLRRHMVGRGVRCGLLLAVLQQDALGARLSAQVHTPLAAKWPGSILDESAPGTGTGPDSVFSFFSRSLTMRLSTLVVSSIAMTGLLSGVGLSLCFGTTAAPEPPILISSPLPKPATERELLNRDFPEVPLQLAQATGSTTSPPSTTLLKYSDQKPDGRKSIAGTGEMIRFELPSAEQRVRAIKIHGSRYGYPRPPAEDFVLRFLNEDMSEVLHERKAPYSLFKRGNAEWVTVRFDQPLKLSKVFWVAVNFNAERTKGVYVSYDSSTAGKYSRVGWPPDQPGEEPSFEGDWMIEAVLTREGATPPGEG